MEGEISKRQVAYKTQIAELLSGRYVKEEGWLPNYIDTGTKRVSRANILGVVVSKENEKETPIYSIDDGTGRISLRFFDTATDLGVGDIVTIIGKPREFGSERYIVPEIIRKVTNPKWAELRKLELTAEKQKQIATKRAPETGSTSAAAPLRNNSSGDDGLMVESEDMTGNSGEITNPITKIFEAIKKLDGGSGAGFDEIIVKTQIDNIDVHIKRLLEQGDIFEIRPGRYKVLE